MKKAISLIEVMISVVLISFVIGILLNAKNQNLFFLDKFNDIDKTNSFILMVANNYTKINSRDEEISLELVTNFDDDNIKKDLKDKKIKVKDEVIEKKKVDYDDITLSFTVLESTYVLDEKQTKKFYLLKID